METNENKEQMSAPEVEKALVCCLLTSENAFQTVEAELRPEMFADASLGFVYQVMTDLSCEGVRPDMVTVEAAMRRTDQARYKELGGLSFLLPYMLNVRHDGNVKAYVAEVKHLYKLRCLALTFAALAFKAGKVSTLPDKLLEEAERSLLDFRKETAIGEPIQQVGKVAGVVVDWHRRRLTRESDLTLVKSGLAEFDYVTGGFHPGELTVVAGRPSDGKTAVTLQMGLNAARAGRHVCFFSLEMSSLQMLNRILAGMTDVAADRLRVETPTEHDISSLEEAARKLENLPFYLDYTAGATMETIRAKVLLQHRQGLCDLIIVDYLHLIGGEQQKGETPEHFVGRHVKALKQLALDTNCPVIVVSQMNRACETRPDKNHLPMISDTRDSGTIEQVADCLTFVYRPERYGITIDEATGHSLVGVGKLYIMKNRNGATGIARFRYNESFTRITDYYEPGTQTRFN